MSTMSLERAIRIAEDRFKVVTSLTGNLARFPILKEDTLDFETDREKSREFAEVFTPLHIVDEMLSCIPNYKGSTLDLCAGHGQFSIRLLRKNFIEGRRSTKPHYFCELQIESCWKLLWIFGSSINLAIGSALELNKLPTKWKGVWLFVEGIDAWVNITETVQAFKPYAGLTKISHYPANTEEQFVRVISILKQKFNSVAEGYMDELKQILSTPNGRRHFLEECGGAASGIEENWQDKMTPEWVCKEMVDCIPGGVTGLKKILVLFNAEFLEILVKQKKVNPRNIDFAFDSKIEGLFASKVYGVGTLSIGKNFQDMVAALEGKSGVYDIVLSNPPYQVQSESQKDISGGNSQHASPIYNTIIEHVIDHLCPRYLCMITPSRWMMGGRGLDKYRARMLSDRRLRTIQDFPGTNEVFTTVSIRGGVNYFLWDRDYEGTVEFNGFHRYLDEFDIVVRDNTSVKILQKVLKKVKAFLDKVATGQTPFGLVTSHKEWVEQGTERALPCHTSSGLKYVSESLTRDPYGYRGKWKVCLTEATHEGSSFKGGPCRLLSKMFIAQPNELCTQTYIVAGAFDTKKEALNYAIYMKTKFYRFMLSLRVVTQHINKQKFAWVPDFGDYTVEYTDQDLYEFFGLTKKEINFIESTIKTLN